MIPTNISVASSLPIFYGIDKSGEKLPATKVDLEAATEKISSVPDGMKEGISFMADSINSAQGLAMRDVHKFTDGRYEAYDRAIKLNNLRNKVYELAAKLNKAKLDSVNTLIKMIE